MLQVFVTRCLCQRERKKSAEFFFVSSKKVYGRWKNGRKVVIDMGQKMARPERKRNSRKKKLTAKKDFIKTWVAVAVAPRSRKKVEKDDLRNNR
jgi:hypothetical protein